MRADRVAALAAALVAGGRGVVALDEPARSRRFAALELPDTAEVRRAWREVALEAPGWERFAGGAILSDESIRSTGARGSVVAALRARGIVPGVALDAGAAPLPGTLGEPVTEGLDGLRRRLTEYALLGAGFGTWRAVFRAEPSDEAVAANAHALARCAALAQENGLVPVLELELRDEGDHDVTVAAASAERVLRRTIAELAAARVAFDGLLLAPTMVAAGRSAPANDDVTEVVAETLRVLGATVPVAVAGIAFLIDGQPPALAAQRLCALNRAMPRRRPWPLTFSYGAALRTAALETWRGREERVADARRLLLHRAYCANAAACGAYSAKLEDPRTLAFPLAA
ncbi:MAG TPA: class I fructose-bisphosphate aldolase [Candidatus Sulfotelmatobacter sp.]|nr:class I fructose-bisphosphate aldolase [Candidatus Sulfotelmatobacter sp.]